MIIDRAKAVFITRTTLAAFGGKMGQYLAAPKNPEISDDQKETLRNPLKSHELAQKKPLVRTNGKVDRGGLEPPTPGFSVQCSTN
jgi:hypothetical protein